MRFLYEITDLLIEGIGVLKIGLAEAIKVYVLNVGIG